jgi:hypothetical protein
MTANLDEDLADVLRTEQGRRIVASLLAHTNVESHGFTDDARRDTFAAGQRSVGTYLLGWVRSVDYDLYERMMREAHENGTSSSKRSARRVG